MLQVYQHSNPTLILKSVNKDRNQSSDTLQHSQKNRPTDRRQMVKILKYDNPDHKMELKIRQIQVMGKSTGQINHTGYEWYIGS